MKILFLGHRDIASLTAINRVVSVFPEHSHSVLLSTEDGDDNPLLAGLAAAESDLCDRFLNGELGLEPHDSILSCARQGFERPNSADGLDTLRQLEPDLIVSIRYRRILHDAAIAIPRLGVINLHSGILPDYRGVMATFWAMLDGREQIGTTLHRITDSGIDTGVVIDINRQATKFDRSYLSNVLSLYPAGCAAICTAIQRLAAGATLDERAQPDGGRYFGAPDEKSVRDFEQRGYRLVDGSEAAALVSGGFQGP